MTQTSSEPATAAPDLRSAFEAVRDHGLRLSAARRVVLAALYAADGPLSAEQIAAGVGGRVPSSDVGSVYRNLETLTRLGIVRHVHLGHSPSLYAISSAGDQEYLTCERCAAFSAVSPDQLDEVREAIRAKFGYVASFSHFPIVGLCAACAQTQNGRSAQTQNGRPRGHGYATG
jgi:Fur family transcriptional regulator, ferric uptake regulator